MRKLSLICALLAANAAMAQQSTDSVAPETATATASATGFAGASAEIAAALEAKDLGLPVTSKNWMIAAANPLAAKAGADILRAGGTAADAMIGVQTVLGLVEPQSSGLGGGAFLVWYDSATKQLTTLDGRETAPLAATPQLFQDDAGEPLKFYDAVVGGRSVGTPGTPALMGEAYRRWGRMPWPGLFDAAITLADQGFAVSPRLAEMVDRDAERLGRFPATAAYFLPGGVPLQAGDLLQNPAYADTLRILATRGSDGFYTGEIANDIVLAVNTAPGNPGVLSTLDLVIYRARTRDPICVEYRSYQVCGMGPPSSGGLSVGQILGQLNHFDLAGLGPDDPQVWRLIGDASRLTFADRGRYMADSDYVPMPVSGLVDPGYLAQRAKLLTGEMALEQVAPGNPEFDHALNLADDEAIELPSTSHISIVDSYGNVLSMTTTVENAFGSRLMVRGFLLNNELTDFSFRTHRDGVPVANRLEPGKRPRSSMAPTIVMQDGAPVLAIGAPGGSRIIGYVAGAIIAWADWGMDVQQAVAMGHAVNRFGTYDLEAGSDAERHAPALKALGYKTSIRDLNSGLHAIAITANGLQGGADPRREGIALGD